MHGRDILVSESCKLGARPQTVSPIEAMAGAETELNFKFYRQSTNRIVGISDDTAALLEQFFQ